MMAVHPHKDQRIGVFIDIQNLYHSAKNLYGGRVSYGDLLKHLVAGRKLLRALGYVVKSDPATGEDAFFEALHKAGIELRIKDIQIFPGGMKKADWDVGLAVDAIRVANMVDVVVIVSGDGDFVPLVEYLKWGLGRTVEVAAFGRTTSARLKESADSFVDLEELPGVVFKVVRKNKR
ncbi:MAG: hypothetical protein COX15_00225 [Candidatus Colwellbacteria bacterium CG23_combo_of_CG06-09_8_20_14_all_42_19]|uniref:NYN domain-containing protein n=1 Tax=Candidatus Colwellbacteria bacterium CG23_combo_of_CG06-09_8_20_14_all_42_19 TaxID=1974541 RepID=A0A2H0AMG6_9BACT|nr:MAG: hypothetical protein COX15_00225 [Candidatus Colwellbacteria bacterium CG23_combo_of_CG06-09_8_20_14_all_42_19]